MYQPLSASRQSLDREDDRAGSRRGSVMATGQHRASFSAQSPTRSHLGISSLTSANNGSYERGPYDHRHHHPPTPAALPPPSTAPSSASQQQQQQQTSALRHGHSSPTNALVPLNGGGGGGYAPREKSGSTFYDPTSDQGDAPSSSWTHPPYTRQSPLQPRRESVGYGDVNEVNPYDRHRQSPNTNTTSHFRHHSPPYSSTRSHPSSRIGSISQSPIKASRESPVRYHDYSYTAPEPPAPVAVLKSPSVVSEKHDRTPNPMAFSSILSDANPEPTRPPPSPPMPAPVKEVRKSSRASVSHAPPPDDKAGVVTPRVNARPAHTYPARVTADRSAKSRPVVSDAAMATPASAIPAKRKKKAAAPINKDRITAKLVAAAMDDPGWSDLDLPEFDEAKVKFRQRSAKRMAQVAEAERKKRKRRRLAFTERLSSNLRHHDQFAEIRYNSRFGPDVEAAVHEMEVLDEKERKKDLQRKRRRERTVMNEVQKRDEAIQRARDAEDDVEREKYRKEAERADRKAKATRRILQGGNTALEDEDDDDDAIRQLQEVLPPPPNLEGGTMTSFNAAAEAEPEAPSKKKPSRSSNRPRKSKEQKQAEKDAAEAAHAAMENDEPLPATPKEDHHHHHHRRELAKKEAAEAAAKASAPPPFVPYVSKTYHQIYDQIWKDMARKDMQRVLKLKDSSLVVKQANCRKTTQLASKEARRWQVRTNKSLKDVQGRAKRTMREMMSFWKQNEKQERDLRRIAEKQELENAKRAEAAREANRQRRKLNFLISQTELYSHFIGRKIKTDEVERSTDSADVAASGQVLESDPKDAPTTTTTTAAVAAAAAAAAAAATTVAIPDLADNLGPKVTNFESLDFDDDDESKLQAIAAANAQSAIQEAQDRARAFDAEGELNFQNPTSLGEMTVAQPEMLTAQLKEYQLKGLNWLVNLYEQGINGILADEMGLGKTVQSISVMAYLAESHNIWGPFLVVAPASTLHNWQQEVTKFVPTLKVLPYWGTAKDRRVLRKFWDRKHVTYNQDSPFHVLVTSYQLVVQDSQYLQKIKWQYMILDEAQAIKSSESSRWKCLLNFHSRNRLLLTGTPIQNNMQELWALLHFIMPSLFDSHDEFSDWFSKDIESHAQSNTKLNEDQLKRLHMILKPFMLRRIKKHVQKELGDKIEEDVACDLTYRQRAYYGNLRDRISVADLIEKGARGGNDQDVNSLMNLVMQFRKVCNHPDLFERADTTSPFAMAHFAETASFLREGAFVNLGYSTRSLIEYRLPRLVYRQDGRVNLPDRGNPQAGFRGRYLHHLFNIWNPEHIRTRTAQDGAFSWLRFVPASAAEVSDAFHSDLFWRAVKAADSMESLARLNVVYDDQDNQYSPVTSMMAIVPRNDQQSVARATTEGYMRTLMNVSADAFEQSGLGHTEQCARPAASAPPVELVCSSRGAEIEKQRLLFNVSMRRTLYGISEVEERQLLQAKVDPARLPRHGLLPAPLSEKARYTNIRVPSMRRFVTDCGKLARLDSLLRELKEGNHRVLLYFQMTRMMDLMEEYLTYRNYKYLRLDGSTSLEDRRDRVHDFQSRPEIFVFVLSTRAGGLGINLTAADTVIFYDSDWNPTIDSQAMDRAHRLGQTRQVTVYRMITRGTIEERIRKRAMQKEEVQRVVISGGSGAGVDFNTRSKENRTKEVAMWLADDDQAAQIEQREAELLASSAKDNNNNNNNNETDGKKKKKGGAAAKKQQQQQQPPAPPRKTELSLEEMYHEGEGNFDDSSNAANNRPSGTATPVAGPSTSVTTTAAAAVAGSKRKRAGTTSSTTAKKGNGTTGGVGGGGGGATAGASRNKRARTTKERLSMVDGGD